MMYNAEDLTIIGVFLMQKTVLNRHSQTCIFPLQEEAMRLAMLMRDTEYRDAMIGMISELYKDIFVEIADASGATRGSLIITDIMPEELGEAVTQKLSRRTIFLSPVPVNGSDDRPGIRIFKYCSLSEIMAAASSLWMEWTGDRGGTSPTSMHFAVCAESDMYSSDRCRTLARQIIYRRGGSILIIPMGFINDYLRTDGSNASHITGGFIRLMYLVDAGRDYSADAFTFTDSYGISYLMLPAGINPVAELSGEHLSSLVRSLGNRFDTLILDIGTCFRRENLGLISDAGEVLWFGTDRRITDPASLIGNSGRIRKIQITDPSDEARKLDDIIRDIYGINERI